MKQQQQRSEQHLLAPSQRLLAAIATTRPHLHEIAAKQCVLVVARTRFLLFPLIPLLLWVDG